MKVFIVGITGILALLIFLPSFIRMSDIQQKNHDYERQIEELAAKNADLREELRKLKDDPEYLEKVAREKMGIVRDGEVIYRITPMEKETGD